MKKITHVFLSLFISCIVVLSSGCTLESIPDAGSIPDLVNNIPGVGNFKLPKGTTGPSDPERTRIEAIQWSALLAGVVGDTKCKGDAKCIAVSSGIGAVVGLTLGTIIVERKKTYAEKQDTLDSEIAWHQKFNAALEKENNKLRTTISSHRKRIDKVNKTASSSRERSRELDEESQKLELEIASAKNKLVAVDEELKESRRKQKQYGSNQQLRQEVSALTNARNELSGNIKEMTAMKNSLGV